MDDDWREIEVNERTIPVSSNCVATYSGPLTIGVRFVHRMRQTADKAHGGMPTISITNVAWVELPPSVAKRMLFDLEAAVKTYEAAFGVIPTEDELNEKWASGVLWHEAAVSA